MWGRLAGGGICVSIFHGSLKTCTCALCPMPSKVTAKDLRGGAARYLCDPFHLHHQRRQHVRHHEVAASPVVLTAP
eukprot:2768421-Pyramimonas_sp.AAC.1